MRSPTGTMWRRLPVLSTAASGASLIEQPSWCGQNFFSCERPSAVADKTCEPVFASSQAPQLIDELLETLQSGERHSPHLDLASLITLFRCSWAVAEFYSCCEERESRSKRPPKEFFSLSPNDIPIATHWPWAAGLLNNLQLNFACATLSGANSWRISVKFFPTNC